MIRKIFGPLLVLTLLVVPQAASASDDDRSTLNVSVTIHMGSLDGKNKTPIKSYSLLMKDGGSKSEMLVGARVAIPVTKFQTHDGGMAVPMTSYTYQNVGFTAQGRAWVLDDGQIKLDLNVEDSHIIEGSTDPSQPTIGTRHQTLTAVLRPGEPIRINWIDDPMLGSEYCEIVAELVR